MVSMMPSYEGCGEGDDDRRPIANGAQEMMLR